MTTFLLIVGVWTVLAALVAPLVGASLRRSGQLYADPHTQAEITAAQQRHPSGRAR